MRYMVAVIGGGAAGLAAAAASAENGASTVLLEAQPRVGKKLLATGNGRCNLTNMKTNAAHYHGGNTEMGPVLREYPPEKIIDFFRGAGLLCRETSEGRVYPYSLQAASVLDALRIQLGALNVEVRCEFPVTSLHGKSGCFTLCSPAGEIQAERVVLAAGGMAAPQLGAGEGGYALARAAGHTVSSLFPALSPVCCPPARMRSLKGARSQVHASLLQNGRILQKTQGEVQFTEQGLSGICIFELSRFVSQAGEKGLEIALDLMPEYRTEEIISMLHLAAVPTRPGAELLSGCLNKLVGREIVRAALGSVPGNSCDYRKKELAEVARTVKNFRFPVVGVQGWRSAQVTAGGVPLTEIKLPFMESKRLPGLFLAGELLDIDGDCGGFNLHWAWSTGLLAGCAAARKE